MKKLQEQRKGEDDNVIAFEQPALATAPKPPGKDWLRDLPFGCRFICRLASQPNAVTLAWYGLGQIEEAAILLGTDHEFNPGHLKFTWVDSSNFSKQYHLVQVLPDLKILEQEEGIPPE